MSRKIQACPKTKPRGVCGELLTLVSSVKFDDKLIKPELCNLWAQFVTAARISLTSAMLVFISNTTLVSVISSNVFLHSQNKRHCPHDRLQKCSKALSFLLWQLFSWLSHSCGGNYKLHCLACCQLLVKELKRASVCPLNVVLIEALNTQKLFLSGCQIPAEWNHFYSLMWANLIS